MSDIGRKLKARFGTATGAEAAANAKDQIDMAAENARLAFITAGAGQALAYQRKEAQARECLANYDTENEPTEGTYPALDAEVEITAATVVGVATVVVASADAWAAIGDAIEATRLGAKKAVDEAADDAAIAAILAGLSWPSPS